jgi:OHCU decarboxylase
MRADPADYQLLMPQDLPAALRIMAEQKRKVLPIAGGTDVMVQFAAGALNAKRLLSIWNLPELRRIDVLAGELQTGAGCTYTDLRKHEIVTREFPLLAAAASWTGGVANQNRGTLGGNIVNASPAADSLPALLVYDAELILISVRGERRVAYRDFHIGYKRMNIAEDELIRAICLPRKFSQHVSYTRKVGARSAQAIAKVCIAALGMRTNEQVLQDIRIALGSVAPVPIRLTATEVVLNGKRLDKKLAALARETAVTEISPISDIRSTAKYRATVVNNLVGEFLESVENAAVNSNDTLVRWNELPLSDAVDEILSCCGSRAWAQGMAMQRPIQSAESMLAVSDEVWRELPDADRLDAFRSHPRIGDSPARAQLHGPMNERSNNWSADEQRDVTNEGDNLKQQIAALNAEYEKRFGHIFLVCASGKNAAEILKSMQRRLQNEPQTELQEMAEQQRQITHIRLKKWLLGK